MKLKGTGIWRRPGAGGEQMRKNHALRVCPVCGKVYHPAPPGYSKKRYCSEQCRLTARRLRASAPLEVQTRREGW